MACPFMSGALGGASVALAEARKRVREEEHGGDEADARVLLSAARDERAAREELGVVNDVVRRAGSALPMPERLMAVAADDREHHDPNDPFAGEDEDVSKRSAAGLRRRRKTPLYYGDYLQLDKITDAQQPASWRAKDVCHDELLFITTHQTYELWFKQVLFELDSVRDLFAGLRMGEKQIDLALHRLQRISEILKLLVDQIRVLETMTPQEFLNFRDYLFPASGFQSVQFRLMEINLGLKDEQRVNKLFLSSLSAADRERVEKAIAQPSLLEYVERWLRNMPFTEFRGYSFREAYRAAVDKMLRLDEAALRELVPEGEAAELAVRELEATKQSFASVYERGVHEELRKLGKRNLGYRATAACLMIMLYQEEPMLQLPARLLQTLVEVDDALAQWRYRHSQMVHRMIGRKIGTGGSLGYAYLHATIDRHRVFSDVANMSTLLIPRRYLPRLPPELRDQMKYFHFVEPYDRTLFEVGGGGDNVELDWSFC